MDSILDLQNKITELLYDYDFNGDAAVGEPEDAYVEEAIIITNFIMNNCIRHVITTDMLADQIQLTMVCRYSGLFPDISLCRGLALEILEYLYEEE